MAGSDCDAQLHLQTGGKGKGRRDYWFISKVYFYTALLHYTGIPAQRRERKGYHSLLLQFLFAHRAPGDKAGRPGPPAAHWQGKIIGDDAPPAFCAEVNIHRLKISCLRQRYSSPTRFPDAPSSIFTSWSLFVLLADKQHSSVSITIRSSTLSRLPAFQGQIPFSWCCQFLTALPEKTLPVESLEKPSRRSSKLSISSQPKLLTTM